MLDTDPANLIAIQDAIVHVHIHNAAPPAGLPAGVVIGANGLLQIDYGYNNVRYGSIEITRGQFAVTRVTNAANQWVPPAIYNHAGAHQTKQSFVDALRCNDLSVQNNQNHFSGLIILSSECCRSQMVAGAITTMMTIDYYNFDINVWGGLLFAFNTYGHTAAFMGYNINAGQAPWQRLVVNDYIGYIASPPFTGDRNARTAEIQAVQNY